MAQGGKYNTSYLGVDCAFFGTSVIEFLKASSLKPKVSKMVPFCV